MLPFGGVAWQQPYEKNIIELIMSMMVYDIVDLNMENSFTWMLCGVHYVLTANSEIRLLPCTHHSQTVPKACVQWLVIGAARSRERGDDPSFEGWHLVRERGLSLVTPWVYIHDDPREPMILAGIISGLTRRIMESEACYIMGLSG